MKISYKILQTLFALLFILCAAGSLSAGPFVSIQRINADKDFPTVECEVSITDTTYRGIPGLTENNLSLYEDGFRINYVRVKELSPVEDYLYLVFSIDSSKSISKKFLRSIKDSARNIMSATGQKDQLAIFRFNDSVKLLNNFTSNHSELIKNINSIQRTGKKTLLYDSVYDAVELLNKVQHKRRAIIVFTDGKDEGSSTKVNDVIDFARDSSIPIYCISLKSAPRLKILKRMSKLTGGTCIARKKASDVAMMYRRALNSLKNRYLIQYKSMVKADGKRHKLEVRFAYGSLKDKDSINVKYPSFFGFTIPDLPFNINQYAVLGFFIFTAIFGILLLFKWERRKLKRFLDDECPTSRVASQKASHIDLEDQERLLRDKTLSELDEKYSYSDAWLVVKSGKEQGTKLPLYWDETTLGRDKTNSIIVDDEAVSLKHAKIKSLSSVYYVFDLVSDNGTYLNSRKLLRPKTLYDWDEIRLGRTEFIFRGTKSS